ncbi:Flp family type IVb pilin [Nocardioides gansuensis]|nr:Flp family type IVb pilin [Nocardioides gansuensis]
MHHHLRDDQGATATEYALVVFFVALAIVLGVTFFGTSLNDAFDSFGDWIVANL